MKKLNIMLMGIYILMSYPTQQISDISGVDSVDSCLLNITTDTVPAPTLSEILTGYIFGVDVSHHNGHINWQRVVDSNPNLKFVIVKASEGGDLKDPQYKKNFLTARKHGLMVGAYHFYNPEKNPTEQIKNFIKTVKLKSGDMVPVLDLEKPPRSKHAKKHLISGIKKWLINIEKHYGVKPMVYTNQKFLREYLADLDLSEYPIWIAAYSYQSFGKDIIQTSAVHQFSASLKLSGIKKPIDANRLKPEFLPELVISEPLVKLTKK